MKRIIFLCIITLAFVAFVIMFRYMITKTPKTLSTYTIMETQPTVTPTLGKEIKQVKIISFNNEQFAYAYFIIQNPANISLISNFLNSKDSQSLMTENGCIAGINGGFYDENNKPLGYFRSGKRILGSRIDSALVNAFIWAEVSGPTVISTDLPLVSFSFALQTGLGIL